MSDRVKMPNGNTYEIVQDEDPGNPRKEWDNLGKLLFFHRKYQLGDENPYKFSDYNSWDELEAAIIKDLDPVAIISVSMLDHSGLTIYEGSGAHQCDPGGWDSGRIGFALVTREAALKEYSTKRITKKIRERCLAVLRSELETYNMFVGGDVWGFVVKDADGEVLDSCFGFYGYKECEEEAKRCAEPDSPKLKELLETVACIS